ncbi:ARM repeat-containing protein [Amylocystis lapponica]|nr:ARM repeat-containing protein [Amylocystis lapponica]
MGILISFLFPRQFMSTHRSQSSASSSSSRSSSPRPDLPPSPLSERSHSPSQDPFAAPSTTKPFFGSPPLESHSYTPHSVGIGILSPQPILGPLAPLTRASISPLHAKSSPSQQRSNPFESAAARHSSSPSHSPSYRATDPLEDALPSSSNPQASSPGPSTGATGLRIALPPPNPVASTSTSSPPLLPPPSIDPIPSAHSGAFELGPLPSVVVDSEEAPADVSLPSAEFNLEFTEFDADGLNPLEKFYLFSKSNTGFHRVFIIHALPRYLSANGASDVQYPAREDSAQIDPLDAVMYVLPLLNGLAMDDDETVKEALAAELVPIIWWFITHCKIVEEDHAVSHASGSRDSLLETAPAFHSTDLLAQDPASAMDVNPTEIPVQAFTPILGTLLLSQNGLVGGPARYAVVELLRRMRRADDDADVAAGTGVPRTPAPQCSPSAQAEERATAVPDVGLLGRVERRLFEREIVHQVVIGMGRLDITYDGLASYTHEQETYPEGGTSPGTETAVPTPMAGIQPQQDSYFPVLSSAFTPAVEMSVVSPLLESTTSLSPIFSPSPTVTPSSLPPQSTPELFSPSASGSSSSMLSTPSLSTPSLVSSSSSSSEASLTFDTPDMLVASTSSETEQCVPVSVDEDNMDVDVQTEWTPASPTPVHAFAPTPSTVKDELETMAEEPEVPPDWQPISESGESAGNEYYEDDSGSLSEEAAMGRLSSMSLMAAVTASGSIQDDTREAFVAEVERVGRDPVYWVRREATFAVGALAKVVPDEVVIGSLLPLFDTLRQDITWHVRHSVLFALPAILSRLPLLQRRALALDVMLALAHDESPTVRSAVLEMLGEVMYTFADDPNGPPHELLNLFTGIRDPSLQHHAAEHRSPSTVRPAGAESRPESESGWSDYSYSETGPSGDSDIYDDPARALVCAFNMPAVALTLGRARWPELRELYRTLAQDHAFKVRRTLAASLGVLADIIGPEQARDDLLGVWLASVQAQEGEVRLKAVECTAVFMTALEDATRMEIVRVLAEQIRAKQLNGWREREEVAKSLGAFVEMSGVEDTLLRQLLILALEDYVSAVREAAISVVPAFVKAWKGRPDLMSGLSNDLNSLAASDSFRKRTTYVSCKQALILSAEAGSVLENPGFWEGISSLVQDPIVDVRIRVARLLSLISDLYGLDNGSVMSNTLAHAQRLAQDKSHEVQAFARAVLGRNRRHASATPPEAAKSAELFSRPPPPIPS